MRRDHRQGMRPARNCGQLQAQRRGRRAYRYGERRDSYVVAYKEARRRAADDEEPLRVEKRAEARVEWLCHWIYQDHA